MYVSMWHSKYISLPSYFPNNMLMSGRPLLMFRVIGIVWGDFVNNILYVDVNRC